MVKDKKGKQKKSKNNIPQQLRFDQPKTSWFDELEETLRQGKTPRLSGVKLA